MSKLIEVKVNETKIWMETEDLMAEEIPERVSREEMAKKALNVGEHIHEAIKSYCSSLIKAFESLEGDKKPNKITAEFGLKLSGDCKVYIVNTSGEASLKISAEWIME